MTRHVRYKQLDKPTIHKATIEIPMIKTPTIEENREVYKQIGILDKSFKWVSSKCFGGVHNLVTFNSWFTYYSTDKSKTIPATQVVRIK